MKQRLKQFSRPHTEIILQNFDYENIKQIDDKFQQFQKEQQKHYVKLTGQPKSSARRFAYTTKPDQVLQQMDSSRLITQMSESQGIRIYIREMKPDEIIETTRERTRQQVEFYDFFIERYFRKVNKQVQHSQEPTYNDDVHFLVLQHGDFLTNSLVSSLVIQTLREQFGDKIPKYDYYGTAGKILQQFGVSPVTLAQCSASERVNYIVQQFSYTLDKATRDWQLKIAQKDKKLKELDAEHNKIKSNYQKDHNDLFYWLTLRTKYKVLQKKLREMLMEKMHEYENSLQLINAMKSGKRINLTGIQEVHTSQLLRHQDRNTVKTDLIWNQFLEKKFIKERGRTKRVYNTTIQASSFNQMGFLAIFDQLDIEDPIHLQREVKMAKYCNGDWLTPQEMQFLANTSDLINRCLNKEDVKMQLQHVNQKQIQQLEMLLSEQIITNYNNMKDQIQNARSKWLLVNINLKRNQIQQTDLIVEQRRQYAINKRKNDKLKIRLNTICAKMENNISIKQQVQRNIFAQIFVRKVIQRIEYIRYIKEQKLLVDENYLRQQERIKQQKQKLFELSRPKTQKEDRRRLFHPSSKLGYIPIDLHNDDLLSLEGQKLEERKKMLKKQQKDYRLQILDINNNQKDPFVKFYTGGPQKAIRQEPLFDKSDPTWIPTLNDKELNSLIKIQKAIRRYINQKKLRNYKEVLYQRQYKAHLKQLDDMMNGARFNKVVQDSTIKVRTKITRIKSTPLTLSAIRSINSSKTYQNKISDSRYLKTEDTADPSMTITNRIHTQPAQVKGKLIKHERLLRYSKLNKFNQIIKCGFIYSKDEIDVVDNSNNTSLYYAAGFGNKLLVEYILSFGANPNYMCSDGTPMHMAIKSQNMEVIFKLIDHGGSLNIVDQQGQTPLVYADANTLKKLGMVKGVITTKQITMPENDALLKKEAIAQEDSIY